MSIEEFGLKRCFDQLGEKIEELKKIRDAREQVAIADAEQPAPSAVTTKPIAVAEPERTAEPAAEVTTKPIAVAEPEPAAEVTTKPIAVAEPEPAAEVTTKPNIETNAEVAAEPNANVNSVTVADPYIKCVDEVHTAWKNLKESMRGRIEFEDLLQRALQSYDRETKNYKGELKQKAIDAMNGEIDRLRHHINNLLQIHKYNL